MRAALVEVIKQDFATAIGEGPKPSSSPIIYHRGDKLLTSHTRRLGPIFIHPDGLVWYGGTAGPNEAPIGQPKDYLRIRDNPDALKRFLGKTLGEYELTAGYEGGHGGGYYDITLAADYPIWLYRNSQHPGFRSNFEQAANELLDKELRVEREFPIEAGRKKAKSDARHYQQLTKTVRSENFLSVDPLDEVLINYGLSFTPVDPVDVAFKEKLVAEWEALKVKGNWRGQKGIEIADMRKVSPELKQQIEARELEREARSNAIGDFTPKLNRLMGLLDIFGQIARPDNGFSESFPTLAEMAKKGLYKDIIPLNYQYDDKDAYTHLLKALGRVQPEGELRDFWLERFSTENLVTRVVASIAGFGLSFKSPAEIGSQYAELLDRFKGRGYVDTMTDYSLHTGFRLAGDDAYYHVLEGIYNLRKGIDR